MEISRITQIYDELDGYSIELEADPTVLGPQYLGKVIAQCRNYLNRTTSVLLEIRREKQLVSNQLAREKAVFKIESDGLLANDERVKGRPNIRDREAIINVILAERAGTITTLENDIRNLDAIESAVKVRHNELVRTDGQIKTQRSLIRDELDTKSYFGDEQDSRKSSTVDESELNDIMEGFDAPVARAKSSSAEVFTAPPSELPASATPTVEEVVEALTDAPLESPVVEATPVVVEAPVAVVEVPAAEPVNEIEAALADAEEAIASEPVVVAEPVPEVVAEVVSEADEIDRFLASGDANKSAKEPAAKGRKTAAKKVTPEVPVVVVAPAEDPDFADILASIS